MRRYSHSSLKLWQRCQLKWKYKYIDRLELAEDKPAMERGRTLHEGLAAYYQQFDPDWPFDKWFKEAKPEDAELLIRYGRKYFKDDQEWEILHVEEEFEIKIGPYAVVYIPDLVVRIGEDVWIVDHKTTKNIPDEWDPYNMTDFQHLLYVAGMQEHYENVRGFIFNYIRTKPPAKPRLIKDGSRIANVRALDTDYDTLREYAMRMKRLDKDVRDKLAILLHAPDRFFQRHFLPINQHAVDQAVKDARAVIEDMARKEDGRGGSKNYPRHVVSSGAGYAACRYCEYQPLCHAEMMGINTEVVLLDYIERPERSTNEQSDA